MASSANRPESGGFLSPVLPSPPPSSAASTSQSRNALPPTRASPLKQGSAKESTFIDYVDTKLLAVSRRYEKRFNADLENEDSDRGADVEGRGYENFGEMAKELEAVIDVIWTSGTPYLQTPYLLSIALTVCTSLPSFPFVPRSTFRLLDRLDLAFCSLLRGVNEDTGESLSGFRDGRGKPSITEKVRMRGLVEKTRVAVVETAGQGDESVTEYDDAVDDNKYDGMTTDDDGGDNDDDYNGALDNMQIEGNHGRWEMEIARVYEKTIVELGMTLDASVSEGIG